VSARGWADRLSGGRANPSTPPPGGERDPDGGHPGLGPGYPAPSNGPDPAPPGPILRGRPPVPEPRGSALRVVLVSRDNMLAGALHSLIEAPGGVRMLDWHSDELDSAIRRADVVVVDMPPNLHERTFAMIDGRFLGRTVVLLQEGEHAEAMPPGPPRAILYRPLQIAELWAAVTGAGPDESPGRKGEVPGSEPVGADEESGPDAGLAAAEEALAGAEERPGADVSADAVVADPEEAASGDAEAEPETGAEDQAAAVQGPGLPVAESGLLIGLSGPELEPVIGPGQVAPGMDEETFERLRRWGNRGRRPAPGTSGTAGARRANGTRAGRASAEARREQSRRQRVAKAEAKAATREEVARQRAARTEARAAAREQARQTRQAERQAAEEASRQAREARAADKAASRQRARLSKAAEAEARKAAQEQARKAKAVRASGQATARDQARQARAAEAEAHKAAQQEASRVKAAEAAARKAAQEEARQVKAAEAEVRKATEAESRRVKAAEAEARKAVEEEARRVAAAKAAEEGAAREEARKAKAAAQEVARRAQAVERAAAREAAQREKAARDEVRKAARAEARQARATQARARRSARAEARQERNTQAAARRAARLEARRAKAVETKAARAERAEARRVAREASRRARAARFEAWKVARAEASQARATRRKELRQVRQAKAEVNRAARAQARQERAAATQTRREQSRQARAAQAQARQEARAAQAVERAAAQQQARQAKAARADERKAARAETARTRGAPAEVGRTRARGGWVERAVQPVLVVVVLAVVAVAAAGWRSDGGPDTRAGEVAVVRAAGGAGGGLVAQDPRMGPVSPLHALAVGTWLRMTGTKASLEGAVREARVPGRFLLAVVVALTVVLFLLLIRVGPGTGAAAGPGPAPPRGWERASRIGGAALAGVLVALDPLLVRNAREATGTILALLLALGALALAWSVPARPALRWLPLVAALGGLALLASPLAPPVLVVPVAADLLAGRHREAWRSMAAVALGIGVWLILPIWVAGQDLGPGQAGWLLGRPPGRGPVAVSLARAPLSWLLVAAGLAAVVLTWRHRSGARSGDGLGAARLLAWMATSAAGALVAIAVGYPAEQALPFAVPAAAVSVAVGAALLVAAAGNAEGRRVAGGVRGTAGVVPRSIGGWVGAGVGVVLFGLLAAQAVDWDGRYGRAADDGLGRLVATVGAEVPACSAVNASGPDDRARLLAAGVTVTDFSDGPAAHAAGVRYFVLAGGTGRGGPMSPSLAAWVRQHGTRLAAHPSRSLSGVELWRVDAAPLDPVADLIPLPDGVFSNTSGSACGGYRVVDSQAGSFHTAYRSVGGKAVLGRPLGSVWTSDGPALQAFDTMVLGAVPTASGPPAVRPIELPPLLAKLNVEAVADADIPLPSATPPVTNRQVRALLHDKLIGRAYLGADPATASAEDFRRARERFGRPLGLPQTMPDGAIRQPFERAVLELPADGGPVRPAALGRLAVRLGLVPRQAMRLEPVPGLPARPAETRLDPAPLLRLVGGALVLLLLAAGAGTVLAWRSRTAGTG
jgi:colicin import membrane protein